MDRFAHRCLTALPANVVCDILFFLPVCTAETLLCSTNRVLAALARRRVHLRVVVLKDARWLLASHERRLLFDQFENSMLHDLPHIHTLVVVVATAARLAAVVSPHYVAHMRHIATRVELQIASHVAVETDTLAALAQLDNLCALAFAGTGLSVDLSVLPASLRSVSVSQCEAAAPGSLAGIETVCLRHVSGIDLALLVPACTSLTWETAEAHLNRNTLPALLTTLLLKGAFHGLGSALPPGLATLSLDVPEECLLLISQLPPHITRLAVSCADASAEHLAGLVAPLALTHLSLSRFRSMAAMAFPLLLTHLSLASNHLVALPLGASCLYRLQQLDLSRNEFTHIPVLPRGLRELDMSSNHVSDTTGLVDRPLTHVDLSGNRLLVPHVDPQTFPPSLELLDLGLNRARLQNRWSSRVWAWLQQPLALDYSHLTRLRLLDLYYSFFTNVDGLRLPDSLHSLSLRGNTELHAPGCRLPKRLRQLDLTGVSFVDFTRLELPASLQELKVAVCRVRFPPGFVFPELMLSLRGSHTKVEGLEGVEKAKGLLYVSVEEGEMGQVVQPGL